jgi:hypothetical protein
MFYQLCDMDKGTHRRTESDPNSGSFPAKENTLSANTDSPTFAFLGSLFANVFFQPNSP